MSRNIFPKLLILALLIFNVKCTLKEDFKKVLMYLNEPLISESKIDGLELDGSNHSIMVPFLDEMMGKAILKHADSSELDLYPLISFQSSLKNGFEVTALLEDKEDKIVLQNFLVEKLNAANEWIYIPYSWSGEDPHAIVIGLRKNSSGLYDLAIINSGSGTKYHYSTMDSNGIYPYVTKLWLDFSNIPHNVIFDERAWFIEALKRLNTYIYASIIETDASTYFYGSVLSNFSEYLIKDTAPDEKLLLVSQRSGSCTMSSLLAALFHHLQDRNMYFFSKLIIGHEIVLDFLSKHEHSEELQALLSHGLNLFERKMFSSIPSGLASFTAHYLEEAYPEIFKNSTLIGRGHSDWIIRKSQDAIKTLNDNKVSLNLLKSTVELGLNIHDILKRTTIDPESTTIRITETDRNLENNESFYKGFMPMPKLVGRLSIGGTVSLDLSSKVSRPALTPIFSINQMVDELCSCSVSGNSVGFICVLNVFKRVNGRWWDLIESCDSLEILTKILIFTESTSREYARYEKKMRSLDNLVMLSCLQLAAWKAAVAFDNLTGSRIELDKFGPPDASQYFFNDYNLSHGLLFNHYIWSNFSVKNLEFLQLILNELNDLNGKSRFAGPVEYKVDTEYDKISYEEIFLDPSNLQMYEKMKELDAVQEILNSVTVEKNKQTTLYSIILTEREKLMETIPHFYQLLNTLVYIFWGFQVNVKRIFNNENFALKDGEDNLKYFKLNRTRLYDFHGRYSSILDIAETDYNGALPLPDAWKIHQSLASPKRNLFMMSKRIDCFSSNRKSIINIDIWLNYVKGALDSEIFASPKFQFISDFLLNVPLIRLNNGELRSSYPYGFESSHVVEIFNSLFRLIKLDVRTINSKKNILNMADKKKIIGKIVNMSIILVRFLERIEYDGLVPGDTVANFLARLYVKLAPFGLIKRQHVLLDDEEVSSINLILGYICYSDLRNSLTFSHKINSFLKINPRIDSYRRTLARVHLFLYKFTSDNALSKTESLEKDLIEVGFPYLLIDPGEIPFLNAVFQLLFLNRYSPHATWKTITYSEEGTIAEAISTTQTNIAVNFVEGLVIIDGIPIAKKTVILSEIIQSKIFSAEHLDCLYKGEAFMFAATTGYALENFMNCGMNFVFVMNSDPKLVLNIFRKYKDMWYWLDTKEKLFTDLLLFKNNENFKYHRVYSHIKSETKEIISHKCVVLDFSNDPPLFDLEFKTKNYLQSWHPIKINITIDKNQVLCNLVKKRGKTFNLLYSDSIGVCQLDDKRMVYIFPSLRLNHDQKSPLVLVERESESSLIEFDILNLPGYIVESNQTIDGKLGLKGTMRIRNKAGEIQLMVPLVERGSNGYFSNVSNDMIGFATLPFVNGKVGPQTRLHRLLLAYYSMVFYNFDQARQLLNPKYSFHQNEVFSLNEFKLIKWFINFETKNAESLALKTFVLTHLSINKVKFSLEYENSGVAGVDEIQNLLKEIESSSRMVLFNYLMSMRDLPEKYYLSKMFPEIRDYNIFQNTFNIVSEVSMGETVFEPIDEVSLKEFPRIIFSKKDKPIEYEDLTQPSISVDLLLHIFYEWSNLPQERPKLIHMTKFLEKQIEYKQKTFLNTSSPSMIVYCLVNDETGIWDRFNSLINRVYDRPNENYDKLINRFFIKALADCQNKYNEKFKIVSHNSGINYGQDNLHQLHKIMLASEYTDTSSLGYHTTGKMTKRTEKLEIEDLAVDTTDTDIFKAVLDVLEQKFKVVGVDSIELCDYLEFHKQSNALSKLNTSIQQFVVKNGSNTNFDAEIESDQDWISTLDHVKGHIHSKIEEHETILRIMSEELLAQIRYTRDIEDNGNTVIDYLFQLMHGKKSKLFNNLYSCYQKSSLKCFQKKFPLLNREDCRALWAKTERFYKRSILVKYFEFLEAKIDLIMSKSSNSLEELQNLAGELYKIFDFNERSKDETILNFEFMSCQYRLKPEQVKDIDLLTRPNHDGRFKSVVIQRMMAAGKSLVLGTISVVKKAISNQSLSIIVPPSSLYQSNMNSMQTRTYSYFKKIGNTFQFPRFPSNLDSKICSDFLNYIWNLIENTSENGNYLILSPDSLHSFLNSYIEVLNKISSGQLQRQDYNLLINFGLIYKKFQENGSIILDEIDMTLDPKKEVNFPLSNREPYNMEAVALITDLIEFAVFDEDIKIAGLDIYGNNQSKLNEEEYENIKRILFIYVTDQLLHEDSIWYSMVLSRVNADDYNIDEVLDFLKNPKMDYKKQWIEEISKLGYENRMNALIIIKMEIHQFLKESFKSAANLNYGLAGDYRPKTFYAVPYVAANTPSISSEFADRWETLNKTLLMFASTTCNRNIASMVVKYIVSAIESEMSSGDDPSITPTWINLQVLNPNISNPLRLSETNPQDVEIVFNSLKSRSPAAIRILFNFCVDVIFSKMDFATEQISSNGLNMVSMFNSVQGYSGTIDNVNILPQEVIVDAYTDHLENEKNNGGIALKLLNDSLNSPVPELDANDLSGDIESLVHSILRSNYEHLDNIKAFIDAGAFFKNFTNVQVATTILESLRGTIIKVVLFYDERTNLLQFVKKNGDLLDFGHLPNSDPESIARFTNVTLEERFTFYDHRHITGSDILQSKTAHGILTVGTRILLRDIFQGTLRMRQFMSTQKVHMLTSVTAREFLSSRIGPMNEAKVSDLLTLGALNEDDKQKYENEKLAFAKIDNEIRHFVLKEATSIALEGYFGIEKRLDLISLLFNMNRNLFIMSLKETPLSWLDEITEQLSEEHLQQYKTLKLQGLEKFLSTVGFKKDYTVSMREKFENSYENLKIKLNDMLSPKSDSDVYSVLHFINSTITKRSLNTGSEVEIQMNSNVLTQVDVDALVDATETTPRFKEPRAFYFKLIIPKQSSELNLPKEDLLEAFQFASLFSILKDWQTDCIYRPLTEGLLLTDGKRVGATNDLYDIVESGYHTGTRPKQFGIFSKYTREGSHLLIRVLPDKKGVHVLLISPQVATSLFNSQDIQNRDTMNIYWVCDLSGRVTITNDNYSKPGMNILEFMPASRLLIFDALVFNASLSQIISSPYLIHFYYNYWLNGNKAIERAKFMILRAKVLFDKFSNSMSPSNPHFTLLLGVSRGNIDFSGKHEDSEGEQRLRLDHKPPIKKEFEAKISKPKSTSPVKSEERQGINIIDTCNALFKNFEPLPVSVTFSPMSYDSASSMLKDQNIDRLGDDFVKTGPPYNSTTFWFDVSSGPGDERYSEGIGLKLPTSPTDDNSPIHEDEIREHEDYPLGSEIKVDFTEDLASETKQSDADLSFDTCDNPLNTNSFYRAVSLHEDGKERLLIAAAY